MDTLTFIKPLLKHRFTPFGMYLEGFILDYLGNKYYDGDRMTWEAHRREAYKQWHRGHCKEDLAFFHGIPLTIVSFWVDIWGRYDAAWAFIK